MAEVYSGWYKVLQSTTRTCSKYATSIKTETTEPVGRFSEAALSRVIAASLPGRFLNRRCFKQCITWKLNQELPSSTNTPLVELQKLPGKGDGGWKKVF